MKKIVNKNPYKIEAWTIVHDPRTTGTSLIILLLYVVLLFRIIITSYRSETKFGQLVSVAVGIPVVFQAFTNMAVAVQLIPVTGQPLPLVSTGGTSIWITFLAMGILLSVSRNNKKYSYRFAVD